MSPMAPSGKTRVLDALNRNAIPFWFGAPHPFVSLVKQDGVFRVRELVVDAAEAKSASEKALADGTGWMPENHAALAKPTGKILIEAPTREAMAKKLEAYKWPADW